MRFVPCYEALYVDYLTNLRQVSTVDESVCAPTSINLNNEVPIGGIVGLVGGNDPDMSVVKDFEVRIRRGCW
jgi:hypothetical protein